MNSVPRTLPHCQKTALAINRYSIPTRFTDVGSTNEFPCDFVGLPAKCVRLATIIWKGHSLASGLAPGKKHYIPTAAATFRCKKSVLCAVTAKASTPPNRVKLRKLTTLNTHSVNDSVNGERRGEVSNTHSRPHNLHGNGEDDGGTSLCRDGVQSLQVSQLEGGRRSYRVSRFLQSTRRIQFTLGRNYLERNIKVELRLF